MTRMADGAEGFNGALTRPDTEVTAKAKRRQFTVQYKLRVLREADALAKSGGIGEMLRREGLYTSHLSAWRRQRERGELTGLSPKKRGRKGRPDKELVEENKRLMREVARLEKRLAQAETIIDVQKKVSTLLGIPLATAADDGSDS
jgi:transposase